jgi:protein SCO1
MTQAVASSGLSELQFAELVDALSADPGGQGELIELLQESHPLYDQRGTAAIVRMRAWILIALARVGLTDGALLFVLEELDTGRDAYLVAAAARALRTYPAPTAAFAPFVMRAIANTRYHDEPVAFDHYGEYSTSATGTTAVQDLLATLAWLGPHARGAVAEIEALRTNQGGIPRKLLPEVDRVIAAIEPGARPGELIGDDFNTVDCCTLPAGLGRLSWPRSARRRCDTIESTVFEDHDGRVIRFDDFFRGQPSIVVFFYTRCDNPQKCSLTVAKLGRVQKMLADRGLAERIRTAAITYDPAFDVPDRLRGYGQSRGMRMDTGHRALRAVDGMAALKSHFALGVNFIESLVNRHRVEVYLLDAGGGLAAAFERIHWDEQEVVNRAAELLTEQGRAPSPRMPVAPASVPARRGGVSTIFGTFASLGVAFFPKCPVCWAAYTSVLGVTALERLPFSPWLQPVLGMLMIVNILTVWMRSRATGRMSGRNLVVLGAVAIVMSNTNANVDHLGAAGVALTLAGSLLSTLGGPGAVGPPRYQANS